MKLRKEGIWKGMLTGFAGGVVGWWAVDRFYRMARASSRRHALLPYCVGAGLGAAYGGLLIAGSRSPRIARVPLGAAIYLARPDRTALPSGGRSVSEKAGILALRLASKGLQKAAEMALFPG